MEIFGWYGRSCDSKHFVFDAAPYDNRMDSEEHDQGVLRGERGLL